MYFYHILELAIFSATNGNVIWLELKPYDEKIAC